MKNNVTTNKHARMLRVLFVAALVLLFAAAGVGAVSAEDYVVKYDSTSYTLSGLSEISPFTGKVSVSENTLTLTSDIIMDKELQIIEDVKLNLNGQKLEGTAESVIRVLSGATLTLEDSSPSSPSHKYVALGDDNKAAKIATMTGGLITNARANGDYISGNNGIINEGTFIMNAGTIAGIGKTNSSGLDGWIGGVKNCANAIFTMNGGVISDVFSRWGGCVYNYDDNARFILNDGLLSNGQSGYGGGVYNADTETYFEMNGGEISNCTATYGAVYGSGSSSSIVINDGKIINNRGGFGGGINVNTGTTLTMTGGEISDNLGQYKSGGSGSFGGGVYCYAGSATISGGLIYKNKLNIWSGSTLDKTVDCDIYVNGDNSNVHVSKDAKIGSVESPGSICLRNAYTTKPYFYVDTQGVNNYEGHLFNGWFDAATGGKLIVGPGVGSIQVYGKNDLWLYPQWAEPVAKIDETEYYSLADALTAVKNGQTIELLSNVIIAQGDKVTIPAGVTLDTGDYKVDINGELTVEGEFNGKIGTLSGDTLIITEGSKVVLSFENINDSAIGAGIELKENAVLTISDDEPATIEQVLGKVKSAGKGAVIVDAGKESGNNAVTITEAYNRVDTPEEEPKVQPIHVDPEDPVVPTTGKTIVGLNTDVQYVFSIPPAVALSSSAAVEYAYSITMTIPYGGESADNVVMKLTNSTNTFTVKDSYGHSVGYEAKLDNPSGQTIGLTTPIVSCPVTAPNTSPVTTKVYFQLKDGETISYAGTYQDTLTFGVEVVPAN